MSAGRWKRQERQIAAALGAHGLPNNGVGQPDIRAHDWAMQVKTRKQIPAWLWAAVDQAERDAGAGERLAVVLSEVTRGTRARRLVVLDFDAWAADVAPQDTTGG
jgi:hypothetical protein